ncbi:MAG TPA: hypothetical protein VMJ10_20835 [Kofleriaceae bacterium]|nr:hypothetical protein [Kofleriaceae bacterium]
MNHSLGSARAACRIAERATPLVLAIAACGSLPEAPAPGVASGIYVVDPRGGDPEQIAAVAGDSSGIKFGVLDRGDGSYDFAYVQDDTRSLYELTARFADGAFTADPPHAKLERTDAWALNGPTYCSARGELAVGVWRATAVDVDVIDAAALRALPATTVDAAAISGALAALQDADFQVSTDLACGNLPSGVVYNYVDCAGRASVDTCLSAVPGPSRIDYKPALAAPPERLTFPEDDADVQAAPPRAPAMPLGGDNGPAVVVAPDASMHVMFERDFTNATSAADPQFQPWGFNKLMYKHVTGDPHAATEYELDFSAWLPAPASRMIVNSSGIQLDPADPHVVDFVALGVFDAPDPSGAFDDEVYNGIVAGELDDRLLPADANTIVLDPARTSALIDFDRFTCWAWATFGMSADGATVDAYLLAYPQWLAAPDGSPRVAFAAMAYPIATLADGIVTYTNGDTEPESHLYARICARP